MQLICPFLYIVALEEQYKIIIYTYIFVFISLVLKVLWVDTKQAKFIEIATSLSRILTILQIKNNKLWTLYVDLMIKMFIASDVI